MNTREFATNTCVAGKETANYGCNKFAFCSAINTRKPAASVRATEINIANKKRRNPLRIHLSHVPAPQIARFVRFQSDIAGCPMGGK